MKIVSIFVSLIFFVYLNKVVCLISKTFRAILNFKLYFLVRTQHSQFTFFPPIWTNLLNHMDLIEISSSNTLCVTKSVAIINQLGWNSYKQYFKVFNQNLSQLSQQHITLVIYTYVGIFHINIHIVKNDHFCKQNFLIMSRKCLIVIKNKYNI